MKTLIRNIKFAALAIILPACDLSLEPYNGKDASTMLTTTDGVRTATLGNYSIVKHVNYAKFYHQLAEYPSDNVTLSGATGDNLFYAYNYRHLESMNQTNNFWRKAYEVIYGTNKIIEQVGEGVSPESDQLLGENYFLRAMAHFDLVTLFARPFTQDEGKGPGIMIRIDTETSALPPRSTVAEVYSQIIADLEKAGGLMASTKNSSFASKEVAKALLARVYLFKGDFQKAVAMSDEVIASKRYTLLDTETYKKYFTISNEQNPETIFAIRHTVSDDRAKASIGSMYDGTAGLGWGEMYTSETYRAVLDKHPEDVRHSFSGPVYITDASGKQVLATRNGIPKYFIYKYSGQDGIQTLSSPVYLRLAEIYLIRAEAYAHLGQEEKALEDVNVIRKRAGLANSLYSKGSLGGHESVLDAVLEEKRIELAFECQRKFDLFRNNRALVRNYPGYHLLSGQTTQVIEPNDPRVVYFIPQQEIVLNPNLVQNP
ncbi:hypothetical protein GCM10023091_12480 [Ravibacter arvi]|uniref:RagB/SusD family nutrient uptake outer membrane protein n=1 Tax=Ravibacter arvi TaxID=2051041 RepID=A0ABP8LSF0_9BACT